MRVFFLTCYFLSLGGFAQSGFDFIKSKQRVSIPFQCINNLIFIPVEVNGVSLTFLLDTGIEETIIFSIDQNTNMVFNQTEKIYLRGLGDDIATESFKTINNSVVLGKFLEDKNHNILVITNEEFNFSSTVGIPVNGIIGFQFFKKHIIEIDYVKQKIIIRKHFEELALKRYKNYHSHSITVERNKPYFVTPIKIKDSISKFKFLIDIGNSDALWLFSSDSINNLISEKHIHDFLGWGFSGSIYGKRAKINQLSLGNYQIRNVFCAFPDEKATKNILMVNDRKGSIGAEIFKRFHIVFDYKNKLIYFKKNRNFNSPFYYNISGIEIAHAGVKWIKTEKKISANFVSFSQRSSYGLDNTSANLDYEFVLKPIFVIAQVRENSVAATAGLKRGDILTEVNGKKASELTLQKINDIIKKQNTDVLKIKVQRGGLIQSFVLKIEDIL
jgi:hypothetical protein